ncbi:MAG: hypothetical protein ACFCVA_13350 [Gammaproteobacteria bacterium]
MEPWYKVATPRKEVREGRSFNPDEFAIALEPVVAGTAPEDYRKPDQFFARTCFTRALREHAGMVLRRLGGRTDNTAPVLTLITQFGGGKTHTLAALYHLATHGDTVSGDPGVAALVREAGLAAVPKAKVGVFVGNAWDPREGRETPWIDIACQLAGDRRVEALGAAARTTPPGTDAIARVFQAAQAPVPEPGPAPAPGSGPAVATRTLRLSGTVPPEVWNRLGTKILPTLRSGSDLSIGVEFAVIVPEGSANGLAAELRQILQELGLSDAVRIDRDRWGYEAWPAPQHRRDRRRGLAQTDRLHRHPEGRDSPYSGRVRSPAEPDRRPVRRHVCRQARCSDRCSFCRLPGRRVAQ